MISHNMSWIKYPSQSLDTHISIEEIIASQNIISRFMHCYIALFVPTGLIASIFILIIFIKNYLRHNALENLDLFLFAYAIGNMITILLSVTVITRPAYLKVTHLGCGTLSFFFNVSYFMSQYLLVLMMITFLLARYPSRAALITSATGRPMLCVGFVLTCAFCISLVVVALIGTDNYHIETDCQLDPLFAWPEYEIVKFTFGFGLPSLFQILCFIPFFVKEAQPDVPSLRQNIHVYLAVLTIMASTFACCLFYNIMILSRTTLKLQRSIGTPKNELMMNIAEIVLFSESCVSSIFVLCLHKQYRHGMWTIIKNLTKICRRKETTSNPPEIPETEIVVTSLHSRNGSH